MSLQEDDVPVITCFFWKYDETYGHVIINNKKNRSQKLILDKPSSQVWLNIDGQRPVSELRKLSSQSQDFNLERFFRELEDYELISYKRLLEDNW